MAALDSPRITGVGEPSRRITAEMWVRLSQIPDPQAKCNSIISIAHADTVMKQVAAARGAK
jgi:hypothetical protein